MVLDYTKEELEQAVRLANDWLSGGEGIDLLYYWDDREHDGTGYFVRKKDRLRDIIQHVLENCAVATKGQSVEKDGVIST